MNPSERRAPVIASAALAVVTTVACRKELPPPPQAVRAASSAASARTVASVVASAPAPVGQAPLNEFELLVERWNRATSDGNEQLLSELYAKHVGLYGRTLSRERAVARKIEAWRKSPGFSQKIAKLSWTERVNLDREASFEKTSGAAGHVRTVRAYLLIRRDGDAWRIVDEGDVQSRRAVNAPDSGPPAGQPRFRCECRAEFSDDPDQPEEAPSAEPPLGAAEELSKVEPAPGAPRVIAYASLYAARFSTSIDIPLFVTVTSQSTNGDGRWFFYELPTDAGAKRKVLDCAHGGFWYDGPAPGKPDPAYLDHPEMKSTETVKRDAEGVHYEKLLYAPDGIESHLSCTISPEYEAYFLPIVRRAGSSLRALPGGWYERTPFLARAQHDE